MSEWRTYKLGEIAEINPKMPLKKGNEYSYVEMKDLDSTLRYVLPSAIRELKGGSKFQNGDTLFARITPCLENGKICQVKGLENKVGFGSTEFLVFRDRENISDQDFIYYLLRSNYVRNNAIQMMTGTSGRQRVETSALKDLEIQIPDLPTQHRIAQILSSLDDKIELNLQMNQTLEAMAQAIFKEWFVNFNFPSELGCERLKDDRVMDAEIPNTKEIQKSSHPKNPNSDSLPKGWKMGKFEELTEVKTGKGLKRKEYNPTGEYPVIGANGELGRADKFLLNDTFLLTGRVGTLGVVKISYGKKWYSDNVLIMKPYLYFFYSYFTLKGIDMISLNRGSTQPLITQTDLKKYMVLIPSNDILVKFERLVNPIFQKIKNNAIQIKTLTNIRDALLPKLMSGKISV